jgi:hypothetical protein
MILGTRRTGWLLILNVLAGPAPLFAQVLEIPDPVQARTATIQLEHLASIGMDPDGPWLSRMTSIDIDSEGYSYAAPTYERGQIAVFDAAGTHRGSFGRAGSGPGEFNAPVLGIRVGPGDSVHVFDGPRHTVLKPKAAGFVRLGMLPTHPRDIEFADDGSLIVVAPLATGEGVRLVHVMSRDGRAERSFVDGSEYDPRFWYGGTRVIARAPDGGLWLGIPHRYEIELWSARGEMVRRIRRDAPWFPAWSETPRSGWDNPVLTGIVQEGPFLWTLVRVPDPDAEPLDPTVELTVEDTDLDRLLDSVVEVLDLRTGRVVARHRFKRYLVGFRAGRPVVYTKREEESGNIVLDVYRLHVAQ